MWILLVILLSNPHHILIISSSYPHHPSLPGLEQARRTLWCLWQALDAGKVDAQDAPGSLEVPDLGFSRHFWNGHFRRLSFSCCERFDMFHERCEHDISWCPWKIYLNFKEKHDSFLDISWCPWNLQAIFFPSKLDAAPCLFKFFLDNNLIALYMRDGFSREEVVWWRGIKTLWQLL